MSAFLKIGIIGAGNMGSGIAQKVAQEGMHVVMIDQKDAFVERGLANIKALLQDGVERRIFSADQMDNTLSRITATTDFSRVADADLVLEAVFEDKPVKEKLFSKLDQVCEPKTIFATNTSSFYVGDFAEKTTRPDRVVGLHYFFHPAKNRLLEIIPHGRTSPETLDKAKLFAKLHGKTAILVKDAPGFAVNRFFAPFLNEAGRMLEQDVANIPTIEAAAKGVFQIGMGPFELMNATGIPITVHYTQTLGNALGPFYDTSHIIRRQMEKNENWDLTGPVEESKIEAVADRFLGVCLGVAAALVDEGVASIEDTDRGAKIGLRWGQGPFEIMNRIGMEKTCRVVAAALKTYPDVKMPEILTHQRQLAVPFEFRLVDLEIKDRTAFITINRPEALNALNEGVIQQLEEKFFEAENNPSIEAIVIAGAGKTFVAGADIRFFIDCIKSDNISDIEAFTRRGHELLLKIENSQKQTIALLDGLSLGGGSELALACQKILATPSGSLCFPETGIGIYPGLGGMLRLEKIAGAPLAKYYTFTGEVMGATDAYDLGLITEIATPTQIPKVLRALTVNGREEKYKREHEIPPQFLNAARACDEENVRKLLSGVPPANISSKLATRIVKTVGRKAPLALQMANDIIDQQKDLSIEQGVALELSRLRDIFSTADALEGLSASMEKRRPQFKGR